MALIQVSNRGSARFDRDQCRAAPVAHKSLSVAGRNLQPVFAAKEHTLMKPNAVLALTALLLAATSANAADLEAGRRLAQQRCAACHIVTGSPRNDLVADAPPFIVIGRKYGFDAEAIALNLVGPHAKMNFALSRPEANDVAAYIQSLAR
jgi:mono/diheme cytochrome c family protein